MILPPDSGPRSTKVTTVTRIAWPARITNIKWGPHRERAPAGDVLAIHSQTKLPLETSAIFTPVKPKSDENYNDFDDPLGLVT